MNRIFFYTWDSGRKKIPPGKHAAYAYRTRTQNRACARTQICTRASRRREEAHAETKHTNEHTRTDSQTQRVHQVANSEIVEKCWNMYKNIHLKSVRSCVCARSPCRIIDTWRNPYLYIIQCAGDPSVSIVYERPAPLYLRY